MVTLFLKKKNVRTFSCELNELGVLSWVLAEYNNTETVALFLEVLYSKMITFNECSTRGTGQIWVDYNLLITNKREWNTLCY